MYINLRSFNSIMDSARDRPSARFSPPMKWSIYVGVYAFCYSTVLLLLLSPISNTLVGILGLPGGYSGFLLALPVVGLGTVVWWVVIERRGTYTYRLGAAFGLLTVLSTVLFWVFVFSIVWGPMLVLSGWFLVLFVIVVSVPIALVTGVSGMYARRRLDNQ